MSIYEALGGTTVGGNVAKIGCRGEGELGRRGAGEQGRTHAEIQH